MFLCMWIVVGIKIIVATKFGNRSSYGHGRHGLTIVGIDAIDVKIVHILLMICNNVIRVRR